MYNPRFQKAIIVYIREICGCVFVEKKQTKDRNEREELFFEDLNFFRFPPFLTPLFSNLFRFFSLWDEQQKKIFQS